MKKTTLMHQKTGGVLKPAYDYQFDALNDSIKGDEWVQVTYSKPKKPKSNKQLGYLYRTLSEDGSSGIYEFMVSLFLEAHGHLYQVEKFGHTITQEANIENVDIILKMFFCIHKGIKDFNKRGASMELMSEYINFLDIFCSSC